MTNIVKTTGKKYNHSFFIRLLLLIVAVLSGMSTIYAHDPAKYTSNSALSDGKWGKVKVVRTGMQFVSAATLKEMGFTDPSKVNAYGFGGRLLPDELLEADPDDLPMLPTVKTAAGIWFFGHNHIRWTYNSGAALQFVHTIQPYAEESWYFLSDRATDEVTLPKAETAASAGSELDRFVQPLVYEQDLYHPATTGRVYLGEDFRATRTRTFNFDLADKAENDFRYNICFAAKSDQDTKLVASAPDGSSTELKILSCTNNKGVIPDETFMAVASKSGEGKSTSEQMSLTLTYSPAGNTYMARLDYIEVSYLRKIAIRDSQLYFTIAPQVAANVSIANADAALRVWDVTDPTRPKEVEVTVSGGTGRFITPGGYREYVAFNPGKGGYAVKDATKVSNQDIHALNTPDMVIISPAEYLSAANTLAAHHRDFDGMVVHVLTPEQIYNEFSSGTPDVGAFRRMLKMWYDRGGAPAPDNDEPTGKISYCLIMSRPTYDNKGLMEATKAAKYPRIPIWQSKNSSNNTGSIPCDDYIGMVDDFENYKSFTIGSQRIRVAVGRMPVTSLSEANNMVRKYINYVTDTESGEWRNRILTVADDADDAKFHHMSQTESMIANIRRSPTGKSFNIEKLYMDAYEQIMTQKGPTVPGAKERLHKVWNDGTNIITYIGHASTVEWSDEKLLEWSEIQNFNNSRLPFLYAATCEFSRYDQDNPCGAEVLWKYPDAGIIAAICPARTAYISDNKNMSDNFGTYLFKNAENGVGRRIGDIMVDVKNNVNENGDCPNKLRFILLGNPAMRIRVPQKMAKVTSIGGIELESVEELPVIKARGKAEIKGVITTPEGAVDTDFNGLVEIILYDAERVVETRINDLKSDSNSKEQTTTFFNNRSTVLYKGIAKVNAGEWSTTVLVPMETENIYTPAQIMLYAYNDKGVEAHGSSEDLYIYGYDEESPEDEKGPEIHFFALNREDFNDGDVVHSSPVVKAKISDESGINLSNLGIGHQITLVLDGKTYFDDVSTYYTPDNEDFTAGHILYPLPELATGDHTLRLTVWDNANNSSHADLTFNVAASKRPEIYDLRTNVNPARDNVTFTLSTDRPMAKIECTVEVFDLTGRTVWTSSRSTATDMQATISVPWDLNDAAGVRVPRGIYLYRATVTSPDGTSATGTRKLAVTAQ